MRILIDYTQIPLQKVGVGIYASNLVMHLQELDQVNEYVVLLQQNENSTFIRNANFRVKKVPSLFRNFFFRFLLEQLYIPFLCSRYNIDVVHSLHYSFPLLPLKAKKVVTIHDLTFFLFPELHEVVKRHYFRFFIKASTKRADKLICVSGSTLNDLRQLMQQPLPNATVIHLATAGINQNGYAAEAVNQVLGHYSITSPYLLFIGTLEPRKNVYRLIRAFTSYLDQHPRQDLQLVLVGKKGWYYSNIFELAEQSSYSRQIVFTGYVPEAHKPLLINGCSAFLYPSLYEGFGIPVLEALACGKPVLTSNVSSMPEVAGNAAMLTDPFQEDAITQTIAELLEDDQLREALSEKALAQAKQFSWSKTAKQTLDAYTSLLPPTTN